MATKAGLARTEHYIVLDGAARIEGEGRIIEANVVTIRLTPDDERVQLLELRGNSRITGGTGGPQSMAARDIDLTYGPDGKTLQFAKLIEAAVLQLPGTGPGAAGKRIAGDTIDMGLAPDGSTVTSLNSNGRVQVDLPAESGSPAKRIKSATMTSTGAPGAGLQNAQFGGGVEYCETRAANKCVAASDRTARSLKLSLDTKPGLGALEKADFRGNVTFTDGPDFRAEGQRGEYYIAGNRLDLTLAEGEPGPTPRVSDARMSVSALRISFALSTRDMTADTNVKSTIMPQKAGSKPGEARMPSMLAPDKDVNVTSNRLNYTKAGATYSGNATLWQDKTTIKGATILIDEKSGNLTASGGATTFLVFEEADTKTGTRRLVNSTGKADTFVYNDAKRLATYTGNAQIDGSQGNVTGDRIDLFLKPGVNELERAVAAGRNGFVVVREGQRLAKGDHLIYTVANENYIMTGRPVEVTEEKNGTCTLTVGAQVTFSRATESARAEGDGTFPHTMENTAGLPPGAETLDGDTERKRADEGVRRADGRQGGGHRRRLRRGRRTARAERRRQDHDLLDGGRPCRPRLGPGHARRPRRHRCADVYPGPEGDRLPAAGGVDLPRLDGRAEYLRHPRDYRPRCRRPSRAPPRAAGRTRSDPPGEVARLYPVGGRTAPGRDHAGPGDRAEVYSAG